MNGLVIAALCVAYAAGFLVTARKVYGWVRPSKAFTCGQEAGTPHLIRGKSWVPEGSSGHFWCCHRRWAHIDYTIEAVACSALTAIAWPAVLLACGLFLAITSRQPELAGERALRLAELREASSELEAELARSRHDDT
jgi:hypothetical protein